MKACPKCEYFLIVDNAEKCDANAIPNGAEGLIEDCVDPETCAMYSEKIEGES
jgi:hypothetical protein